MTADAIALQKPRSVAAATPAVDLVPDAEQLYRELAPVVRGYARSQGAPEPDDLVGEVFLHVARDLERFRGDRAALRRWLFTIAHHRLVDDRRRRAARVQSSMIELPELAVDDRPASLDPELIAALAALTPLQREVVVLRFVADLPLADVAKILRRRVGAVKAAQARALDSLARLLGVD